MDWGWDWSRFWPVLIGNCLGWTIGIFVTTWWLNRKSRRAP